jgi:hypothetical protein
MARKSSSSPSIKTKGGYQRTAAQNQSAGRRDGQNPPKPQPTRQRNIGASGEEHSRVPKGQQKPSGGSSGKKGPSR